MKSYLDNQPQWSREKSEPCDCSDGHPSRYQPSSTLLNYNRWLAVIFTNVLIKLWRCVHTADRPSIMCGRTLTIKLTIPIYLSALLSGVIQTTVGISTLSQAPAVLSLDNILLPIQTHILPDKSRNLMRLVCLYARDTLLKQIPTLHLQIQRATLCAHFARADNISVRHGWYGLVREEVQEMNTVFVKR